MRPCKRPKRARSVQIASCATARVKGRQKHTYHRGLAKSMYPREEIAAVGWGAFATKLVIQL